jgi:hypothetical protein
MAKRNTCGDVRMNIEFSKEDIKKIRRIARNEIEKVFYKINEELFKQAEKDYIEEYKK